MKEGALMKKPKDGGPPQKLVVERRRTPLSGIPGRPPRVSFNAPSLSSMTPLAEAMGKIYEKQAANNRKAAAQTEEALSRRENLTLPDLFRLLRHFASPESASNMSEEARMEAVQDLTRRIKVKVESEEDSLQRAINAFADWSGYDEDMRETNHEKALETLLKMTLELNRLGFGGSTKPMIGGKMLEMAGGTGTVVRLVLDSMNDEEKAGFMITLNDVTASMIERAMKKLYAERTRMTYTSHDIRQPAFKAGSFDCAVLSQTFELITDPELLQREREDSDAVIENTEHRRIKRTVVENALSALGMDGLFHIITEFPAQFKGHEITDPFKRALRDAEAAAFDATFRPLRERSTLTENILRNVVGARIVAVLKARIDSRHSLYNFIVRKDEDKLENRGRYLPVNSDEAKSRDIDFEEVMEAREKATQSIVDGFTSIDPYFRETYVPRNGERKGWSDFLEINTKTTIINPTPEQLRGETYDTIIISRILHHMDYSERAEMIKSVMGSLERGGSLMLIDEWKPPHDIKNPLRKGEVTNVLMERYQGETVIFEGMLREHIMRGFDSGMYGWHYRKIR